MAWIVFVPGSHGSDRSCMTRFETMIIGDDNPWRSHWCAKKSAIAELVPMFLALRRGGLMWLLHFSLPANEQSFTFSHPHAHTNERSNLPDRRSTHGSSG